MAKGALKPIFFDRSVIDNIAGVERMNLPLTDTFKDALVQCRYARQVFLVPPWHEIYMQDNERRHFFLEAEREYYGLVQAYATHGYEVVVLPMQSVKYRADFVESIVLRNRYDDGVNR